MQKVYNVFYNGVEEVDMKDVGAMSVKQEGNAAKVLNTQLFEASQKGFDIHNDFKVIDPSVGGGLLVQTDSKKAWDLYHIVFKDDAPRVRTVLQFPVKPETKQGGDLTCGFNKKAQDIATEPMHYGKIFASVASMPKADNMNTPVRQPQSQPMLRAA